MIVVGIRLGIGQPSDGKFVVLASSEHRIRSMRNEGMTGISTLKKIRLKAMVEVGIDFYPEDFEGSETTWEQFILALGEPTYVVSTLKENVLDFGSMLTDDVLKQISIENISVVSTYERDEDG